MFNLVEQRPHANAPAVGLVVHFTNRFDAYYLLGKVYWCGCEFIAFITHNIFTDFESVFPACNPCTASCTTSATTALRRSSTEAGGEEDGEAGG